MKNWLSFASQNWSNRASRAIRPDAGSPSDRSASDNRIRAGDRNDSRSSLSSGRAGDPSLELFVVASTDPNEPQALQEVPE